MHVRSAFDQPENRRAVCENIRLAFFMQEICREMQVF